MSKPPHDNFLHQSDPPVPILVLAGDVNTPLNNEGMRLLEMAAFFRAAVERYQHVLFVPGNHSFYSANQSLGYSYALSLMRRLCSETGVTYLDHTHWDDGHGTRYIGATLWGEVPLAVSQTVHFELSYCINDFAKIYVPAVESFLRIGETDDDYEANPEFIRSTFSDIKLPDIPQLHAPPEPRDSQPEEQSEEAAEQEKEMPPLPELPQLNYRRMMPVDVTAIHIHYEEFLREEISAALQDPSVERIVVVTHHPPIQSYPGVTQNQRVHSLLGNEAEGSERYRTIAGHMAGNTLPKITEGLNAFSKPLTWVCGHTHTTGDRMMFSSEDEARLVPLIQRRIEQMKAERESENYCEPIPAEPTPEQLDFQASPLPEGMYRVRIVMNCKGYPTDQAVNYNPHKVVVPGQPAPAEPEIYRPVLPTAPEVTEPKSQTSRSCVCACTVL